jgi:gliding motility-associated lipoprotein GldH
MLSVIAVMLLSSCDSSRIFEENTSIPEYKWFQDNIIKFEVDIEDEKMPTNFYINIRNADGYPYSNIYIFIKTTFPDNKTAVDTLECILADEQGNWLGSGMGDIFDNQIPFKRNVKFPTKGKYTFELQHGMRGKFVPLIMDIGMRIEKAE